MKLPSYFVLSFFSKRMTYNILRQAQCSETFTHFRLFYPLNSTQSPLAAVAVTPQLHMQTISKNLHWPHHYAVCPRPLSSHLLLFACVGRCVRTEDCFLVG